MADCRGIQCGILFLTVQKYSLLHFLLISQGSSKSSCCVGCTYSLVGIYILIGHSNSKKLSDTGAYFFIFVRPFEGGEGLNRGVLIRDAYIISY